MTGISDSRKTHTMRHRLDVPSTILPPEIEEYRDACWHRQNSSCIQNVRQAEKFVERVGYTACLTDARKPGPSLYVAICGRRDAIMPRNVQKDAESSHTWMLKDEMLRRGRVFYGKLARGKAMFVAPRMIPYFNTIWGISKKQESARLSGPARSVLKALRKEWELSTAELREAAGLQDRKAVMSALDELQAALIVVPMDVVYEPRFTYLWGLAHERFPKELSKRVEPEVALQEIARSFLSGAGMTTPGELARVTGLSRPQAGIGNQALVRDGFALRTSPGTYRLRKLSYEIPPS